MANIPLQSITFPGLSDKYTTPTVDATLTQTGAAADAKKTGDEIGAIKNDLSEKADKSEALSAYIVETETGSIASFSDGADDVPVKDLTVAIEPVQSGSGDPSPENVRPISGWTGANVTRTGKNLVDIQDYSNTSAQTIVSETSPKFASIPYKENTRYTISADVVIDSARAFGIHVEYTDNTSEYLWLSRFGSVQNHVTTASGKTVSIIVFGYDVVQTVTSLTNVMLEEGTTASVYEPFGTVYSIDWTTEAGTVYGGTLDVTTGVLTVDSAMVALSQLTDWGDFSTLSNGVMRAPVPFIVKPSNVEVTTATMSTRKPKAYGPIQVQDVVYFAVNPSGYVVVPMGREITVEEFLAECGNDQLCYSLRISQTYQLTPQEVSTILGQNNIFADCGNVTVQYRADTKLYIDKVLSA